MCLTNPFPTFSGDALNSFGIGSGEEDFVLVSGGCSI
jgi:hypothetical protein